MSLYFFLLAFSCEKQQEKNYKNLFFELPISVYPVKDTLRVGDTLWIETKSSDLLYESSTKKTYQIANVDFSTRIAVLRNETPRYLSQQPGALNSFKVVTIIRGIEQPQETFADFKFNHENNQYIAHCGLIPQKKGVYSFTFFSQKEGIGALENAARELFQRQNEAIVPLLTNYGIRYPINEGSRTNFHLFKKYGKPGSLIEPNEMNTFDEQKATYTFVVVD